MSTSKNIRINQDFKYVMFHHSEHFNPGVRGVDINAGFVQEGLFGVPQDIIVNVDGKIDLSPRWIRAENANHFEQNVPLYQVFKYPIHDISDSCENQNMNYVAIHLLVVGNFDQGSPTVAQLSMLNSLLILVQQQVPTVIDVVFHGDIVSTSCPGVLFPPKQYWRNIFQGIS